MKKWWIRAVLPAAGIAAACWMVWQSPSRKIARTIDKACAVLEKEAGENVVAAARKAAWLKEHVAEEIAYAARDGTYAAEGVASRNDFVQEVFAIRNAFDALAVARRKQSLAFPGTGKDEALAVVDLQLAGETSVFPEALAIPLRLEIRFRLVERKWLFSSVSLSPAPEDSIP
jgi:hypothetical protein